MVETREWARDPGDAIVLQCAAADGRVLITIDSDFGQLIFEQGAAHHGVVRLPDVPAPQRIAVMADLLARDAADLQHGAFVTVRGGVPPGLLPYGETD